MLAYAANGRPVAGRAGSPRALSLVLAAHAVVIAAVLTTKMEVVTPAMAPITRIIEIAPEPAPPPPEPPPSEPLPEARPQPAPQQSFIDVPPAMVDMGRTDSASIVPGPAVVDLRPLIGPAVVPALPHAPVRQAAIPRTPESRLRPPYPNDKLRNGEEATLRLRLTIDPAGRVSAVIPVGPADPSFLEAARRHIVKAWRYRPATEDGIAVSSTLTISLSFRLEDA